jgi:hypothetical protein
MRDFSGRVSPSTSGASSFWTHGPALQRLRPVRYQALVVRQARRAPIPAS